jgi:hypothetical protein
VVELELEPLEDELDFSDEEESEELADSELPEEPFDELVEEVLADSRLSVR